MQLRPFQLASVIVVACLGSWCSAISYQIHAYAGTNSTPTWTDVAGDGANYNLVVDKNISRVCIFSTSPTTLASIGTIHVQHDNTYGARTGELQIILMDRPANVAFPDDEDDLDPFVIDWGASTSILAPRAGARSPAPSAVT